MIRKVSVEESVPLYCNFHSSSSSPYNNNNNSTRYYYVCCVLCVPGHNQSSWTDRIWFQVITGPKTGAPVPFWRAFLTISIELLLLLLQLRTTSGNLTHHHVHAHTMWTHNTHKHWTHTVETSRHPTSSPVLVGDPTLLMLVSSSIILLWTHNTRYGR